MNSGGYSGLLQASLIAAAAFALAIAFACALAHPALRWIAARMAPARRADLLLFVVMLPLAGAGLFLLLSFAPSLLSLAGLAADHCHLHLDHPHLCLQHPPAFVGGVALMALGAFALAAPAVTLAVSAAGCWRTRRLVASLVRLSQRDDARGVHVVPVDAPMAFAAGLRAPELFVSRRLLERLTPQQLAIVIAHERAHAARRDALRQLIANCATRFHLPWVRRRLLADLAMASELACDERAALQSGDRLAVAQTLIAVEKLFSEGRGHAASMPMAVSHFNGSNIGCRVQALLAPPFATSSWHHVLLPALALLPAALVAIAAPLHHWTESFLGFLFH